MNTFTQMAETWIRRNNTQVVLSQKSSPRPETLAEIELLPAEVRAWDDALLVWATAHCAFCEQSWGSLSRLYVAHIEHAHQTGGIFAPDVETFRAILMALGFVIEDGMCHGLLLAEGARAAIGAFAAAANGRPCGIALCTRDERRRKAGRADAIYTAKSWCAALVGNPLREKQKANEAINSPRNG